jgi:hypothetical protein
VACLFLALSFTLAQNRPSSAARSSAAPSGPEKFLFEAVNRERAAEDLPPLQWDSALAAAARKHVLRMAEEPLLDHQYAGEASLRDRAADAGAHFSFLAENIAVSDTVEALHMAWMHSPGHRYNILNPDITSIGIATVERRGFIFATQDFSHLVEALTIEEQERRVAALLAARGLKTVTGSVDARNTCVMESGHAGKPAVYYRYETADLSKLPEALSARIDTIASRIAAVGACTPKDTSGFTRYRVAVVF